MIESQVSQVTEQIAGFVIDQRKPLYRQISDNLRQAIRRGDFPAGTRLPPSRQLEALWSVNAQTIHAALSLLVKEGLLDRLPGRGTFVRRREPRLTCVGIYHHHQTFGKGKSLFLQSLNAALKAELDGRGIATDVWVDPRPAEQQRVAWPALVQAAEARKFQAMIVPVANLDLLRWQPKLPVPTAFGGAPAGVPNSATPDIKVFAELGLRALARQGCRSVGLIMPIATTPRRGDPRPAGSGFFERFVDVSRDLGLTIKSSWMRVVRYDGDLRGRSADLFGYEQFVALWRQAERPQGLIVHDDVTARGVLMAILAQQVRVPQELKLVLAKNEDIDLLCPLPATFIVASERELAQALVVQVEKQFRGERCEPIILPFRVIGPGKNRP